MLIREFQFSARSISLWLSFHSFDFVALAILVTFISTRTTHEKIGTFFMLTALVLALLAVVLGFWGNRRVSGSSTDVILIAGVLFVLELVLATIYILLSNF